MELAGTVLEELWFADDDPRFSHEVASRSMAASLARAMALKPFPHSASEALSLLSRPNFRVPDLEKALGADPTLAARVLQVANSPAYSPPKPIESLRGGVVLLGANSLREVVVAAAMQGMFSDASGAAVGVLEHSVGVAAILRGILARRRFRGLPPVFMVGLLHDVGKLLLLQSKEIRYSRGPATFDRDHLDERARLGFDHAVLGAHALREWKIPEPAPQVVAWHHQHSRALEAGGNLATMVSLLRLADRLEYELSTQETLTEAAAHDLTAQSSAEFLGYSAEDLQGLVGDLAHVRVKTSRSLGRLYSWRM